MWQWKIVYFSFKGLCHDILQNLQPELSKNVAEIFATGNNFYHHNKEMISLKSTSILDFFVEIFNSVTSLN